MKNLIVFFLLSTIMLSCNNKQQSVIKYWSNGKIKTEYFLTKNNKISGIRKDYYESGKINLIRNYNNGLLDGKCYKYYPNGNIMIESTYCYGKENGWCIKYNSDGSIKEKIEKMLFYKNENGFFHFNSDKLIEKCEKNIKEKESIIINHIYYYKNKVIRDSSYYCTVKYENVRVDKNFILKKDSLLLKIEIPFNYFSNEKEKITYMLRIEDTNENIINILDFDDNKYRRKYIPCLYYVSFKPKNNNNGYIYGVIREVNSKGEA
ncbi:MAG: hypothetical protein JW922_07690, partial [Paludibacteraceae bacterium]|nr:hypothetical protein [Paludibacteraceae bacterium]